MSTPCIIPHTLRSICGEDKALIEELLNLFEEQTLLQLHALPTALEAKAYEAIKVAAHTLKGSASYVGAQAMFELCQKLESAALGQEADNCKNLLVELKSSFILTQKALRAEFSF